MKVKVAQLCLTFVIPWTVQDWITFVIPGLYRNSPGQNTGVGSLSVLQGIFPTRGRAQVSHIAGRFFTSRAHKGSPTRESMRCNRRFSMLQLRRDAVKKRKKTKHQQQLNSVMDCYVVLFLTLSPCQPLSVEVPGSFAVWFQISPPLLTAFIYFFKKIYLFSFGCAGSSLLHRPFSR